MLSYRYTSLKSYKMNLPYYLPFLCFHHPITQGIAQRKRDNLVQFYYGKLSAG